MLNDPPPIETTSSGVKAELKISRKLASFSNHTYSVLNILFFFNLPLQLYIFIIIVIIRTINYSSKFTRVLELV